MPPTPLTHRPQTLKQAKRAYRKSGGTVLLSESEKAMLERRAVLQERADRIKEREARRKANLKRKEERVQKEREARHRMGIPTPPPKEGIQVGPSQLHLSGFMYAGGKRKMGEKEEEKEAGIPRQGGLVVQEQQGHPVEAPGSPKPLKTSSPNTIPTLTMPSQLANAKSSKVQELALQNRALPNRAPPARFPLQSKSTNPTMQPKSLAGNKHAWGVQTKASNLQEHKLSPMISEENRTIRLGTSRFIPPPSKPPKPKPIPDDNLDDFFVSNTQIQRELSPPPAPPTISPPHVIPTLRPPPPPPPPPFKPHLTNEDTTDLLSLISTQDLDFSFNPTQINPAAAPRHEPEVSSSTTSSEEEDKEGEGGEEEEDFPDSELEEIVLEFSLESPIKPSPSSSSTNTTTPHQNPSLKSPPNPQPHNDSNSSFSSDTKKAQASLLAASPKDDEREETRCHEEKHQEAAEWDIFDLLSTQDFMELAS